jgi:DNA-binding CsgD family transcriptional regulator
MQRLRAEQVKQDIVRRCHTGLDSRTLRIEVIKRLREVIPFDVSFFPTADPATLLFTSAVADEILQRATPQFMENEFLHDDVNKFVWLARSKQPVNGLVEATEHELVRSPRYRDILAPLALGDELRAALITNGVCWGFMCLHREQSSQNFTDAEAAFLGRLAPHIAEGLRTALLLGGTTGLKVADEPGLLVLAEDLSIVATTPAAERWLTEIAGAGRPHNGRLPYAIISVVARLKALEQSADVEPSLMPKVRLRTDSGQWLVLRASRLSGSNMETQIAVIFEAARSVEIAPLIVQAYDLSRRESEVMQSVLCGSSTAEIMAAFHISSNTVQDHLKAIFDKVGVRSRRELVGQVFAQQYQPRLRSSHELDANGWFS